jgi:phenylalanyl-tRNA synthetase beta chain
MKFSEAWLREWIDPPLSAHAIGERLTMAGLELDSISPAAPAFSDVVVAQVIEVTVHPGADHLKVCRVDDGHAPSPQQVVCGAANVRSGVCAAFARVGARLPDGTEIKQRPVSGVESFGMLCSAQELGLAESSTGLLTLPPDAPIGQSIREYLQLDDTIIEVDLTPNRADCLSMIGIAQELATLTDTSMTTPPIDPVEPTVGDRLTIAIEAPEACPRYVGRVIRSITQTTSTPLWMQERLRRGGIRGINPVVDVTNYVMLELGQPMHAFDLSKLRGGIHVRHAQPGQESLKLLDGRELSVMPGTLVIADQERPLALAGIMGGQASAVDDETRDVFLESAFFAPHAITGKPRMYALSTDSSHRFERGVDPDLQARAMERATQLLLQIAGGQPGPLVDVVHAEHLPVRSAIKLRPARATQLLGIAISTDRMMNILRALGCKVEVRGSDLLVLPPSYRFDLGIEADLIEELGRIDGYDRIPATTRSFAPTIRSRPQTGAAPRRLRSMLVDRGYQEAITYSFVDADTNLAFNPDQVPRKVANPISAELTVMRGSLWPGLIKVAQYNLNRQQARIRLFELGLQFTDDDQGLRQTPMLAALALGDVLPEQWGAPAREVDFYDVKGDVEALLSVSRSGQADFQATSHPALHPGQSARVALDGRDIGWLGVLHPALARRFSLRRRILLFSLELAALKGSGVPCFQEVSKFPAIRRDLAVVVDAAVTAAEVKQCLINAGDPRLQAVHIFDVYAGEGIAAGRKSLALGLILQDLTRTLHDEEVDAIVSRMVAALTRRLGAALRV